MKVNAGSLIYLHVNSDEKGKKEEEDNFLHLEVMFVGDGHIGSMTHESH